MKLHTIDEKDRIIFLAWQGQNASTGTPNVTTNRMSFFGELVAFKSREKRNEYCDNWNHRHNTYPKAVNYKTGRSYCLGMSVRDYEEHILHLSYYDEEQAVWEADREESMHGL